MRLSLREVFQTHQRIAIPLLQRDYAHGRASAGEVRSLFIKALHATLHLAEGDPRLPMDLDFVYGSCPQGSTVFHPLDGQQRLTTLFLLHWYLAARDGALPDFRTWACYGLGSAFSYDVRPSSKDFFDALVGADVDLAALDPARPDALSKTLEDQAWFFQSWQLDPTIRSCLVVLDAIHGCFAGASGLYARMALTNSPYITFQFLDLQNLGLTDDLYIKMNARGKPLTAFETFKASFEEHVPKVIPGGVQVLHAAEVPTRVYIARKFDTQWCDLFWDARDPEYSHDRRALNGIRAVAVVAWARGAGGRPDPQTNAVLQRLRDNDLRSFYDYQAAGCLSDEFVRVLIRLFDRWSEGGATPATTLENTAWYDEQEMFRRVLGDAHTKTLNYAEWVQFVAWCEYILSGRPAAGMHEWMRVIVNLSENTIYNRVDEFRASLVGLRKLVDGRGGGLLEQLAKDDGFTGFNRQQIREERLKAQLLLRGAEWRTLIEKAEMHRYFRGQIEFLFSFTGMLDRWLAAGQVCVWDEEEDEALRTTFAAWLAKATAVFRGDDTPGLRPLPELVWERALLCEGDYLLGDNINQSFLKDRDPQMSWKRLLRADLHDQVAKQKRDILGRVLENVDVTDVAASLRTRIAMGVTADPTEPFAGWRERLVETPDLIRYCHKRQVRVVPGEAIYLLHGERRNGRHLELFTHHLFLRLLPAVKRGDFAPFDRLTSDPVTTDTYPPTLVLASSSQPERRCTVTYAGGFFHLQSGENKWSVEVAGIEAEIRSL
jgi:hypothetical protein